MDHLSRALIFLVLLIPRISLAVTAANVSPASYCYSDPAGVGACKNGQRFDDAMTAALYACQQKASGNNSNFVIQELKQHPLNMPGGLNSYGKFYWSYVCTYDNLTSGAQSQTGATGQVTAEPDCSPPILNYSPASCSGTTGGSTPPPVACSNTNGVIIPAFHMVPVVGVGCYAGCSYTSVNTSIVEWNGGTYNSGTWNGSGTLCGSNEIALYGGAPGNSQPVNGGALSPGDLLTVAQETTLQSVLQLMQAGANSENANQAIWERIAAAAETTAAGGGSTTPDDPDGFEADYAARMLATQVDANGKLPDSALNAQTVDVGGTFANVQGFIGASSCPIPPSFSVRGHNYSFDIAMICDLASALSYLVVTLASIAGVRIFMGGL